MGPRVRLLPRPEAGKYRVWTHRAHRDNTVEDFEWALKQEPYRPHEMVYHPLEEFSATVQQLAVTNTDALRGQRAFPTLAEAIKDYMARCSSPDRELETVAKVWASLGTLVHGDRVAIGSEVRWEILRPLTSTWAETCSRTTFGTRSRTGCGGHTGSRRNRGANATRARVRSVEAVYWKRESGAESRYAVAGSAVVEERERATGQEPERDGVDFAWFYLVELEPMK